MNSKEIIDYLKSEASEKYKENVIKMGIPGIRNCRESKRTETLNYF